LVTTTFQVPVAAFDGIPKDAVILVEVTEETEAVISDDPDRVSFTFAPLAKLVPVTMKLEIVSERPPSVGVTLVILGAGAGVVVVGTGPPVRVKEREVWSLSDHLPVMAAGVLYSVFFGYPGPPLLAVMV